MVAGVYVNTFKDEGLSVTKSLICALDDFHIDYYLDNAVSEFFPKAKSFDPSNMPAALSLMFVVGGDGTVLNIIHQCAALKIPVLAVNMGHLGFLTEVETGELKDVVGAVAAKNFTVEGRSIIEASAGGVCLGKALNECVISRESDSKMIEVQISVNGQLVDSYVCDGVIISTPTGSTAYSLSAGGPILSPTINAFCITPICAHTLHSRPIVVGDGDEIRVTTLKERSAGMALLDGTAVRKLNPGESVIIGRAENDALFVRIKNPGFYQKLLKKLNKWSYTKEGIQ